MIDQKRIARVLDRLEDLERLLGDPDTLANPKRLKEVVREHAALKRLEADVKAYTSALAQLADDQALIDDPSTDAELRKMAEDEVPALKEKIASSEQAVLSRFSPPTRPTSATRFSKSAPARAATRRPSSPAISSACTAATARRAAGRSP